MTSRTPGSAGARFAVAAVFGTMLVACRSDDASAPFVVRDSAGVTIVESYEGLWGDGAGWRLSAEPVVTIGSDDGPEEYSLYQVRDALTLPSGRIVVANSGSDQLRYYDSSGQFLYSVGRDGYGPGEFKVLDGMWLVGDSLFISDRGQDRVSVFSAQGEYARTLMLHREPGAATPSAVGVFSDGTVLGRQLVLDRDAAIGESFEFRRYEVALSRFSRDGAVLDTLGVLLLLEAVLETIETTIDTQLDRGLSRAITATAPFGKLASTVARGETVYHGSSDSYEIQELAKEGGLRRLVRRPIPNAPVTERDKDRFRDDWLDSRGDWGRRRVNDLDFPATKPAYGAVRVDALGYIWVEEYTWPHENAPVNWTVFDPDGRLLGVVEVPGNGIIFEIGRDHLLGRWRTELGVEQVKVYRLFRN